MNKDHKIKSVKAEVNREIIRAKAESAIHDDRFLHARDKFRTPSFLQKYITERGV